MGDENGSGGNKIETVSTQGNNKPVKIRKFFFTRQVFKEEDISHDFQSATWAISDLHASTA